MTVAERVNAASIVERGWFSAHRWLLARRLTQIGILTLFLLGPLFGLWLVKGNLTYSLTLDVLPLTDIYVLAQSLAARHWPETIALTGALIVILFYGAIGGRVYCSWVCPVNMVTDAATWARRRFGIKRGAMLSRHLRFWVLAATLIAAAVTGTLVWEVINPVSMMHRAIIFGAGFAWLVVLGVFLFDLVIAPRGWCGHVCPVGAFYGLVGSKALLRVAAPQRALCNNCMDCFAVCPEPQVISPVLKGAEKGVGPVILAPACTACGRCIDVCSKSVFTFGTRLGNNAHPEKTMRGSQSQPVGPASERP